MWYVIFISSFVINFKVEQNPNVKFEDIASLEDAKQTLQEAVLLPLLCPDLFIVIFTEIIH